MQDPFVFVVVFAIFVMSVVADEVAHGWVALQCGDPTALKAGRLTLNPLPHIDPMMTVVLPLMLILAGAPFVFGGAKPVPINPFLLRNRRRDWMLVSAAGVAANLLIAVVLAVLLRGLLLSGIFVPKSLGTIALASGVGVNIFLALFNLLPIPPLDGSWIVGLLFPDTVGRLMSRLQPVGFILLILLIWLTPLLSYLDVLWRFIFRLLLGL